MSGKRVKAHIPDIPDLQNVGAPHLDTPTLEKLEPHKVSTLPPRIQLLYGFLRERSYSLLLTLKRERIPQHFCAETRVLDPHGLSMAYSFPADQVSGSEKTLGIAGIVQS